ncbi:MAG TPA: filamentous hemagglutinin N-terminal domain-containing protein [Methylomirabilota bacterium]|nr:filamentous hemagglutinin N-terminal domain-containing protein [Methylomirabilota bacterium]
MRYRGAVVAAALAVLGALLPAAVDGQITIDGSLRPNTAGPLAGPNYVIGPALGRTVGNNLFHSFGQFNVHGGESATFTGPNSTANVIGRVTGGQGSSINGLIDTRTFMPSANFFLLNPAGIMLGPGAALNIGGAFHFSTADYLCLGSRGCLADPATGKFFASLAHESVFTVAAPAAFGFLGPPVAGIVVEGTVLPGIPDAPAGQTMSLVGGPVQVTGATVSSPGGHLRIVSMNGKGEVSIPSHDVSGGPALGPVTVTGSAIDVSGDPGGSVSIRGGNLVLDSTVIMTATGAADGGAIELNATGSLSVTSSVLLSQATGSGRGGEIRLNGTSVEIINGSAASSVRAGDGAGGDIVVSGDTVKLAGGSALVSQNSAEGTARNGAIEVSAGSSLHLTEASALVSAADAGDGGPITVSAGSLTLDQGAAILSSAFTGRGGEVLVTTPHLTLLSGAQILSQVVGPGRGAELRVISTGTATIAGQGTGIVTGSFFADPAAPEQGLPGDISARFGSLTLTDHATIQSGVIFGSQGGNVTLIATGPIVISNGAGIASESFFNDTGSVTISAPLISVNRGFISTSTFQSGRAGDIVVSGGSLELAGGGQIASASIASATGRGGDVHLSLSGTLTISGNSGGGSVLPPPFSDLFTDARSGIFTTAAGTAPGGNVTVRAAQIRLDGGVISAASTGTADALAGNIDVTFGDLLRMRNATIGTDSVEADGGNIIIVSTGSTLHMIDSQITTSVGQGLGSGGNITLGTSGHPIQFIVLDNSGIHANAFEGPGGNINIFASVMLSSTPIQTAVTASSALSTPGVINIVAVATDVSGSIPELSADTHEAAALLRASCAARLADGKTSSLVVAGREGVPLEPGGLLPSVLTEPRHVALAGEAASFLAGEWPRIRLSYLDAACGR